MPEAPAGYHSQRVKGALATAVYAAAMLCPVQHAHPGGPVRAWHAITLVC